MSAVQAYISSAWVQSHGAWLADLDNSLGGTKLIIVAGQSGRGKTSLLQELTGLSLKYSSTLKHARQIGDLKVVLLCAVAIGKSRFKNMRTSDRLELPSKLIRHKAKYESRTLTDLIAEYSPKAHKQHPVELQAASADTAITPLKKQEQRPLPEASTAMYMPEYADVSREEGIGEEQYHKVDRHVIPMREHSDVQLEVSDPEQASVLWENTYQQGSLASNALQLKLEDVREIIKQSDLGIVMMTEPCSADATPFITIPISYEVCLHYRKKRPQVL